MPDTKGYKIDFILDSGIKLKYIEVKSSKTIIKESFKRFKFYLDKLADVNIENIFYIIYGSIERKNIFDTKIIPWTNIS